MYVCLDLISNDVDYFLGGGNKSYIYLGYRLSYVYMSCRSGRGWLFSCFSPLSEILVFFSFRFLGGFFWGKGGGGGKGGCICRLMCGVGLGRGFLVFLIFFS